LTKKSRGTRLWEFDPSVFQPGPRAGFVERHIIGHARSLGKYTLYLLAFSYPGLLVILGVMFGGLIFWTSFACSIVLIWLVIRGTGYSRNFQSWDSSYKRVVGVIGGFCVALGLFYGLEYTPVKGLTVPIFGGIMAIILIIGTRRFSNR
jgi:hypothetical protein